MKFEEALKVMREGKKVKRPLQYNPRMIYDGRIIEVLTWNEKEPIDYEPLTEMSCENILAEDWEIVDVWCPLSDLGQDGKDFDLIPADEFLECVKVGGFIDDDGNGYPVIKTKEETFLYKDQGIYPSEIIDKEKLDFDFVAWFNK